MESARVCFAPMMHDCSSDPPPTWTGFPRGMPYASLPRFHLKIGHCEIQNRTPGVETGQCQSQRYDFADKLHDGAPQIPCQSALACRAIHQPNRLQREPAPPHHRTLVSIVAVLHLGLYPSRSGLGFISASATASTWSSRDFGTHTAAMTSLRIHRQSDSERNDCNK
jgi:hypothetical protein